jgi:predicted branched-subunit amino acid permease
METAFVAVGLTFGALTIAASLMLWMAVLLCEVYAGEPEHEEP